MSHSIGLAAPGYVEHSLVFQDRCQNVTEPKHPLVETSPARSKRTRPEVKTYPLMCQVFTYTVMMINCKSDTHKCTVVDADTSKCSLLNVLELFPFFLSVISEMIISHAYVITGVISRPNVCRCRSGVAQAQILNKWNNLQSESKLLRVLYVTAIFVGISEVTHDQQRKVTA